MNRAVAAWKALWLDGDARAARFHERRALGELGGLLPSKLRASDDEASARAAKLLQLEGSLAALDASSAASLQRDREQFSSVPRWAQLAVVVRGVLDRLLLRLQARRDRKAALALRVELAAMALAGRVQADGPLVPAGLAQEIASVRAELRQAEQDRATLLAPWQGYALPGWMRAIGREILGLGTTIAHELRGRLLPRWPALAGAAVGWWIAHTYTDSHVDAVLSHVGLRHGGTHVISSENLERMSTWLPLVVGACCSYASNRFSAFLARHYALPQPAPALPPADPQAARTVLLASTGLEDR